MSLTAPMSATASPVAALANYLREEIGTVADYEGREANDALRRLTARLCG